MARLSTSKRFVVKVGSRLLVESTDLSTKEDWLQNVAEDIALCRQHGQDVIVVSSGAVAMGRRALGHRCHAVNHVAQQQAAAAVGQGMLLSAWNHALARHHLQVGQALLSLEDMETKQRALNARDTFDTLLSFGVVPVINENDTVATDEIRFGDNDRLAARVAQLVDADTLVLLSDVDGLYTANPQQHAHARHIPFIEEITPSIEKMATLSAHHASTGGMVTKLMAARIAMQAGCRVVMASGHEAYPLRTIDDKSRKKTWFLPQ
ncbi:MAG: glutamate 5-kinase [Alphaproteobacteria bacterium GM7ARS4]|nr:glutamate 5-kinase [Alphaproteobacteria bacterium GM7ARS4]